MTIALFLTYDRPATLAPRLQEAFRERALAFLAVRPEVKSVDLFHPAAGEVLVFGDEVPPPLLVQIDVDTVAAAEALVAADGFAAVAAIAERPPGLDVFQVQDFPIAQGEPVPRTAPLSFVVRYFGPTDDDAAFARHYVTHHPPILARLPGVRNVLCYLPVAWRNRSGLKASGAFFGNEVVFDDLAALNRSMVSPVLAELRRDSSQFPRFGHNTHHAMLRRREIPIATASPAL